MIVALVEARKKPDVIEPRQAALEAAREPDGPGRRHVPLDRACRRRRDAAEHANEGRLSLAIAAEKGESTRLAQLEIDVAEDAPLSLAESLGDLCDPQARLLKTHQSCLCSRMPAQTSQPMA
ncbi:hypothetical protein D3C87_1246200 [compost metagenome]